ncbi:MAG: extracellular solute-binding protein [Clostridia bacterium]|nr:extracellular solute-binding protein [Clostridia bacterium]
MKINIKKIISFLLVSVMLLSAAGCKDTVSYTVSFDSMGGTLVDSQTLRAGQGAVKPADPVKQGFTFVEWQLNETAYDFTTPVNEDITLTAFYKIIEGNVAVTVTLDAQNGEPNKTFEVVKGGLLIEPTKPQKQGFTFAGWYLKNEKFDFSAKINQNITLTAKWEAVNGGGSESANVTSNGKNSSSVNSVTTGNTTATNSKPSSSNAATSSKVNQQPTDESDAFDNKNDATFYKTAPKDEVHVLMFRNWRKYEQLLIDKYQQLTGVTVKTTVVKESEFPNKLVSMVALGDAPDVAMVQYQRFASLIRNIQPLDSKLFHLDADCWNKELMNAYRVNGHYYSVAQSQSWSCEDSNYVTYYNPSLLNSIGVTATPYELYKQGNWNWETQADILRKAKAAGKGGISLEHYDLFMHSTGQDFVKYDGNEYTSTPVTNTLFKSAWQEVGTLYQKNYISNFSINDFEQGKSVLLSGVAYGLCNESDLFDKDFAKNLEAVPIAGPKGGTAYTPVEPKIWCVPKNAKNVEGAAYFLRYLLDASALNLSSTFHNKQFEAVYNTITKPTAKKSVMYGRTIANFIQGNNYNGICSMLSTSHPANINIYFEMVDSFFVGAANNANKSYAQLK